MNHQEYINMTLKKKEEWINVENVNKQTTPSAEAERANLSYT